MTESSNPALEYIFSSCEENPKTANAEITGNVPEWLNGSLFGVGPGLFEIGEHQYNHYSDGMALMCRFDIKDGAVSYQSKFLRSDTFVQNNENQRIMFSEGGTMASPDPDKNMFQRQSCESMGVWPNIETTINRATERVHDVETINDVCRNTSESVFVKRFSSRFSLKKEPSDNCGVTFWPCSNGEFFAVAENKYIRKVDPDTLGTEDKVDLSTILEGVDLISAHTHMDADGTQYGLATAISAPPKFIVFKIPPATTVGGAESILKGAQVLSTIKGQFKASPCYVHSFGMTKDYLIVVECPFFVNVVKLVKQSMMAKPVLEAFDFDKKAPTKIHIIRKDTGEHLVSKYVAAPMAVFHHINSYEDKEHIVMDLFDVADPVKVMHSAYLKSLKNSGGLDNGEAKRFVIPLQKKSAANPGDNLVTLEGATATATLQEDGNILCTPVKLTEKGFERPQINYSQKNGSKYKYFYATGGCSPQSEFRGSICKVNVSSKKMSVWRAGTNEFPQEAVFVPKPDAEAEDEGVLIATAQVGNAEYPDYLVILDAQTMTELARATLPAYVRVPRVNHELFVPKK